MSCCTEISYPPACTGDEISFYLNGGLLSFGGFDDLCLAFLNTKQKENCSATSIGITTNNLSVRLYIADSYGLVTNGSEITISNSSINGTYLITAVGTTQFIGPILYRIYAVDALPANIDLSGFDQLVPLFFTQPATVCTTQHCISLIEPVQELKQVFCSEDYTEARTELYYDPDTGNIYVRETGLMDPGSIINLCGSGLDRQYTISVRGSEPEIEGIDRLCLILDPLPVVDLSDSVPVVGVAGLPNLVRFDDACITVLDPNPEYQIYGSFTIPNNLECRKYDLVIYNKVDGIVKMVVGKWDIIDKYNAECHTLLIEYRNSKSILNYRYNLLPDFVNKTRVYMEELYHYHETGKKVTDTFRGMSSVNDVRQKRISVFATIDQAQNGHDFFDALIVHDYILINGQRFKSTGGYTNNLDTGHCLTNGSLQLESVDFALKSRSC